MIVSKKFPWHPLITRHPIFGFLRVKIKRSKQRKGIKE
jgi:hypothetical protein